MPARNYNINLHVYRVVLSHIGCGIKRDKGIDLLLRPDMKLVCALFLEPSLLMWTLRSAACCQPMTKVHLLFLEKKNPMMWMEDRGAGEGKADFDVVLNERTEGKLFFI